MSAELYFRLPEFTAPALSPDGRNIAFIAQTEGHACLFKLDRVTGRIEGLFNPGKGDVKYFWWLGNQRVLVGGNDVDHTTTRYFLQELVKSKPRLLSVLDDIPADRLTFLPDDPGHVLALDFRQQGRLIKIDVVSGYSRLVESFISDLDYTIVSIDGEVRAKILGQDWKWHTAWRSQAKQPWHTAESPIEDWPNFLPGSIAADIRHILGFAFGAGDTVAVELLDPETGQRTVVARRPHRDTYTFLWQAPQATPVGAIFYNNGPEDIVFFDEEAKRFSTALDMSLPGMLHRVTSASKDGNLRIIQAWQPCYPARYFLFDQVQLRLSLLGEERPGILPGALGNVHFFQFTTRDGVNESGYVIMPKSAHDPKPVPLLVMAMGEVGECAASANYFSASDQFFVSRGFAVAHFAVRGSAGYGRKFKQAGEFQLAGKIVEDFEDGVAHLAHEKLIHPDHVALMGYGRGGLFALRTAALSKTFSAAVAYDTDCDLSAESIRWMSSSLAETRVIIRQAGGSHKAYEWSQVDYREADHVSPAVYEAGIYTKIADFLDKTLKCIAANRMDLVLAALRRGRFAALSYEHSRPR